MESKTFKVPGISCGHCVHTIKTEVSDIPGVERVEADQQTKMVTVSWNTPADWEKIRATLVEINYPPEGLITIN
ncbi:MAG: heavy-metal-associated domain-containing protein [Anaerolineae bacterium]|nr:heavy-metal-associated domain-containing protein [Anaerolineae bacterium]RIK19320.1 MAG: heavy metal transporter [Anaerolineae bacterium]